MKARRTQNILAAALACALAFIPNLTQAQETLSPMVKQLYNGQWSPKEDQDKFRDELLYLRAVDAYMFSLSALNVIGMRDGSEATFGAGYNVLPIWKDRMNGKTLVPTPNCDVVYAMSYLDLKKTGHARV